MKKLLIIITLALIPVSAQAAWWNPFDWFSGVRVGAPTANTRLERNINPETDSTYELGNSSKAWLKLTVDEVCLTNDSCETTWPAGGGGGGGDSVWTRNSTKGLIYTPTTTDSVVIGRTSTTTNVKFEVNGGIFANASSTIVGGLTVLTSTSTSATSTNLYVSGDTRLASLTGLLKASTGVVTTAVSGTDYSNFGASVGPTELQSTDFGDFTCNGTTCALDATYLTGNQTITISGDVDGSGTTAITATLDTVNSNTGSFGSSTAIPNFTVNGKGLITAAGTNAVVAPAGTLTGTTLNSSVVTSSLTSVGTLTNLTVTNPITGSVTGNAGTATALAANGTNCSAGNYPLGVDASGNAEGCTTAGSGSWATSSQDYYQTLFRDWSVVSGTLRPTTTVGIIVAASSTINALTVTNGTTTNSTTTNSYDSGTTRIQSLSGILKGTTGVVGTAANGTDYTLISATTCGGTDKVSAISASGVVTCSADQSGGGGSGGGSWSTTTSQVSGQLINYPNNGTDVVVIGSNASTTAEYWFDPNTGRAFLSGSTTVMNLGTVNSTSTNATTTNLAFTGLTSGGLGVNTTGQVYKAATTTYSTGLTYTNGAVTVNTSQNIAILSNLPSNGFVKTSSGNGTLTVDTTTYESGLTAGDGLTRTANDFDCDTASGSVFGCLSSADWTTFNGKQASGNYITALTGDITASGPGSAAATLATVNSNVGSFTNATLTVNAKGLVTAVSSGSGGTGNVATSSAETAGQLPYWTSTNGTPATLGKVATTSVTCTGDASCTPFTVIGSSPITISSSGGAGGSWATTSEQYYWTQFRDLSVQGNGYLAPTTTRGLIVSASSTINSNLVVSGRSYVGTSTNNYNETFVVASGTPTTSYDTSARILSKHVLGINQNTNEVPFALAGLLHMTGSAATSSLQEHGVAVIGAVKDNVNAKHYLIGVEGKAEGVGYGIPVGIQAIAYWQGSTFNNRMILGNSSEVRVTTDGSTALNEGIAVGNYIPTITGGNPLTRYGIWNQNILRNDGELQVKDTAGNNYMDLLHDGSNSYITSNTGNLILRPDTGAYLVQATGLGMIPLTEGLAMGASGFRWDLNSRTINSSGLATLSAGLLAPASSTISALTVTNGTTTNATTTNFSATTICISGDCKTAWPASGSGAYPFAGSNNSTSSLTQFNGGLTSYASTTIGNGTQAGGLTISGGATTTGNFVIGTGSTVHSIDGSTRRIGVATSSPFTTLSVGGAAYVGGNFTATGTIQFTNISGSTQCLQVDSSGNVTGAGAACGSGSGGSNSKFATSSDSMAVYPNGGIDIGLGIGTTTPHKLSDLNVASTSPAFILSDTNGTTNSKHFGIFFNDGKMYFATTSDAQTATSSAGLTYDPVGAAAFGLGTSTPFYKFSIGSGNGSSTASILVAEHQPATSTSMTIDWTNGNQQMVRLGNAAMTISFSNYTDGATLKVIACNPPTGTAGTITWGTQVLWAGGSAPSQTTTAQKCDVWSFLGTQATSTLKVFGSVTNSF